MLTKTKKELKKLLRVRDYTIREGYNDIFLATTRKCGDKDIRNYRLTLVQLYRDTCWEARVGATHKNQTHNSTTISSLFLGKVKHFYLNNIDLELLEKLDKI